MNILFLTDKIDYVSGVAKHLYYLTNEIIKKKEDKVYIVCSGGDMKEEFINSGANVIEYPGMSFENRTEMKFLISIGFIMRFCVANKVSIIHSHTHYTANLAYFVSRIIFIRTVQTVHGLIPEEGKLPHFRADHYIAVNKMIIDYMTYQKIKPAKITVIRQGVPAYTEPVKKVRPLKVLCASRLVFDKGVDIFINSVSIISDKLEAEAEFIVAGEGEYEAELKKLAVEKGAKINFMGKLNNLNQALAESHIFVFPSRIKTEGFPVVLNEAGMNTNLIITSNFDSLNEVLESTKDCIIFYNDDYEDLAKKLMFAINNYGNLLILADHWKRKCLQEYTSEIMTEKTSKVYTRLLGTSWIYILTGIIPGKYEI